MTEWIEEQNLRAELGGVVGVIRAVVTGLLVAGAKSFTHMITFVERYGAVLDGLLREAGPPVGSLASGPVEHMRCASRFALPCNVPCTQCIGCILEFANSVPAFALCLPLFLCPS